MTVDLLAELDRIADRARTAQDSLRKGLAVTGSCALRQIEEIAMDAARHGRTTRPVAKRLPTEAGDPR